jgi:hypothetical protein
MKISKLIDCLSKLPADAEITTSPMHKLRLLYGNEAGLITVSETGLAVDLITRDAKMYHDFSTNVCKKCGGNMTPGKAIENGYSGYPDFPGDKYACTVSVDPKKWKLVDCLKCEKCGWSTTV